MNALIVCLVYSLIGSISVLASFSMISFSMSNIVYLFFTLVSASFFMQFFNISDRVCLVFKFDESISFLSMLSLIFSNISNNPLFFVLPVSFQKICFLVALSNFSNSSIKVTSLGVK